MADKPDPLIGLLHRPIGSIERPGVGFIIGGPTGPELAQCLGASSYSSPSIVRFEIYNQAQQRRFLLLVSVSVLRRYFVPVDDQEAGAPRFYELPDFRFEGVVIHERPYLAFVEGTLHLARPRTHLSEEFELLLSTTSMLGKNLKDRC